MQALGMESWVVHKQRYHGGMKAEACLRDSIVVSISACHVEDPGSIPGRGADTFPLLTQQHSPSACGSV